MPLMDSVLTLDMGPSDCFYRIRKVLPDASCVVYVHLQDLDIIAEDRRTYGPSVIDDLREKIDVWNEQWTTLDIFMESGKVQYKTDTWKPHFLPESTLDWIQIPRLNVLDLEVLRGYKNRVSLIQLESRRCFLKICPFKYQLRYFAQEIQTYEVLFQQKCTLQPRILAYVFERSEEQIIGFICEGLLGRFATIADYETCKEALTQLHSYDIIHGDLNKYNIIITSEGPRFIDFEKAILCTNDEALKKNFLSLKQKEVDGLREALSDEEGWGRPWAEPEL